MSSVDDRTGRARVRDAALELIAERAEVSPALVVHHFGSRAGLREVLVDHIRPGWTSSSR
ncbi:TetR family transcriptional regulator [Janibacter hoylei]